MAAVGTSRELDTTKQGESAQALSETLKRYVVGQERATGILVDIVEAFQAGFCDHTRPAGNALFLGPTGTGKTHVVESFAEGLFGTVQACVKIDCAEFQHSHEIAKLIGSPPGYLGHRETNPAFTQERLNQFWTDKLQLSIVLFDEIEKSSDSLWSLMLGILDKGTLTLGDNRKVDFKNTIIVMTSNLGARQMSEQVDGGLGFVSAPLVDASLQTKLEAIATSAAKSKFTPEFMNRLQNIAVFSSLTEDQIGKILDLELDKLRKRIYIPTAIPQLLMPLNLVVSSAAKLRLIKEGYNKTYGARHLTRAIDRLIQKPLARIVASKQVTTMDTVIVDDRGGKELKFYAHTTRSFEGGTI